jgi:hypothetical protein
MIMPDFSEIDFLRHITNCQTDLVLNEARLAAQAIGRVVEDQEYEDQDDLKGCSPCRAVGPRH